MKENPQTIRIETPEHIELQFTLAGIGTRIMAWLVDKMVQLVGILGVALVVSSVFLLMELTPPGADALAKLLTRKAGPWIIALAVIVLGIIMSGYFILFEYFWSGSTPGKRSMHIRVIRKDGRPITLFDSAVRNILRVVDLLAMVYPIGLAVMFIDSKHRRLGDLAAGTLVILENTNKAALVTNPTEDNDDSEPEIREAAARIDRNAYRLISRYLSRREGLDSEHREDIAREIFIRAFGDSAHLGKSLPDMERSLEQLQSAYRERTRIL